MLLKALLPPGPCSGRDIINNCTWVQTWRIVLWPCSVQSQKTPTEQLMQYMSKACAVVPEQAPAKQTWCLFLNGTEQEHVYALASLIVWAFGRQEHF